MNLCPTDTDIDVWSVCVCEALGSKSTSLPIHSDRLLRYRLKTAYNPMKIKCPCAIFRNHPLRDAFVFCIYRAGGNSLLTWAKTNCGGLFMYIRGYYYQRKYIKDVLIQGPQPSKTTKVDNRRAKHCPWNAASIMMSSLKLNHSIL